MKTFTILKKRYEITAVENIENFAEDVIALLQEEGYSVVDARFRAFSEKDAIHEWQRKKRQGVSVMLQLIVIVLTTPAALMWMSTALANGSNLAVFSALYTLATVFYAFKVSPIFSVVSLFLVASSYIALLNEAWGGIVYLFAAMLIGNLLLCGAHGWYFLAQQKRHKTLMIAARKAQ